MSTVNPSAGTVAKAGEAQGRADKVIDISVEAVKQQITLSTLILGALLTFTDPAEGASRASVKLALIPLALTIVFGVLSLLSIAFFADHATGAFNKRKVRAFGALQNLSFVASVAAMVYVMWT